MTRSMSACSNAARWLLKDDGGSRMEFVLLAAIIVALGGLAFLALRRLTWTET
ncbi:hypothetical protein NX773_15135 [Massilia solisilvae]|uniref:Uncharacterized protein n=1 Tax=Massilia solisilvae TaxID=1811225 RepID=A0ABT2BLW4_9BURK|nr:hypothetical protein [Massilia solisilvae]MCS0609503.1 hypothetical protein [Massilia solisilvae]